MTGHSRTAFIARVGMLVLLAAVLTPLTAASAQVSRPVVRKLSPSSDTALGGAQVTVNGSGFTHVIAVKFGSSRGTSLRVLSAHKLMVTVPRHAAGQVKVWLITRRGQSAPSTVARFRYTPVPPPTVDSAAPAVTVGPLPAPIVPDGWSGPNPSANCGGSLDYCGAAFEGLAPAPLPANWSGLSNIDQAFVLLNLERVERGETPLLGISATLDQYAAQGAAQGTDPDGAGETGGNWYGAPDSVAALRLYLYDDGPGGGNLACSGTEMWGCWGHRDNILDDASDPNLSVGLANGQGGSTESFGDTFSDFVFTWAQELSAGYPQGLPASFMLSPVALTAVSPVKEADGSVTLQGDGLDTASAVYFSGVKASGQPDCNSAQSCTVSVPGGLAANTTYYVYALNAAGLSASTAAVTYTTAP